MAFLNRLALVCVAALAAGAPASAQSPARIRQQLIRASIAAYPGSCPCPYNHDRAGQRCGGRSAYSRPGGRDPLCYPSDVSPAMIKAMRAR